MDRPNKYKALERLIFLKHALYAPIPVVAARGVPFRDALSRALAVGTAMGALGLGAEAMARMADSPIGALPDTLAKGNALQAMLEVSPELRAADPQRVRQMFNVLYQYFPAGAAEPMTAAGIVGGLVQYDRVDHKTVQDLIAMQKGYSDTRVGARKAPMALTERLLNIVPDFFQ